MNATEERPDRWRVWRRRLLVWPLILLGIFLVQNLVGWLQAPSLPARAPAFALQSVDGEIVRLEDLEGRTVVLNFWATWCGPCRMEIPSFARFARNHPEVTVLGIAVDGEAEDLRRARQSLGIPYPILLADAATLEAYKVRGIPQTVVVRPDGSVRSSHVGMLFGPQLWWLTR